MPWTWTHLACNATGTGEPRCNCTDPPAYMRSFWLYRISWALVGQIPLNVTLAERARIMSTIPARSAAIVDQPIERKALAELMDPVGVRWMVTL